MYIWTLVRRLGLNADERNNMTKMGSRSRPAIPIVNRAVIRFRSFGPEISSSQTFVHSIGVNLDDSGDDGDGGDDEPARNPPPPPLSPPLSPPPPFPERSATTIVASEVESLGDDDDVEVD